MKTEELAKKISDDLNLLAAMVKTRSRASLNDGSVGMESIAARFFNALFDWKLINLNTQRANYPAADLGDKGRRLAMQVTIQASPQKIDDTQKKAKEHKLRASFERIIIFFSLPEKPGFPRNFAQLRGGPKIETWDIADILKLMLSECELPALEKASRVLDKELPRTTRQLRKDFDLENGGLDAPRPSRTHEKCQAEGPKLMARFQEEEEGELCIIEDEDDEDDDLPAYGIDLWIEGASNATKRVDFEILEDFEDNPWFILRAKGSDPAARDFLTDDMTSWGDVAILAKGGRKKNEEPWFIESTLYEALNRFYDAHPRIKTPMIKRALKQIRDN